MFGGIGVAIGEFFAKSMFGSFFKSATGIITAIPKPVWEAITVVLYVLALLFLHQHYANAAIKTAYDKGYAQAVKDIKAEEARKTAEVVAITNEGDGQQEQVNRGVQKTYAKDVDSINATADRLRRSYYSQRRPVSVSGPDVPSVPDAAAGATAPVVGGRPEDDRLGAADPRSEGPPAGLEGSPAEPTIVVPALQLIDHAVRCDTDHAALKAWWKWYDDNLKIYQDWVAKVQKAAQPEKLDVSVTPPPAVGAQPSP